MVPFMNRFVAPVLVVVLLAAPAQTVRAQDAPLRGSLGGAAPQGTVFAQDDLGGDGTEDDTGGADDPGARAPALDTDAGEVAEPLAEAGRIRAVQPFSERLRAVSRRGATGGGGSLINDVYDGDTQRDAPRGIRVGSFLLYPELFTGLGWTDNRSGDTSGTSGLLYRIAPTLRAQSDWSRHSLGVNFRGSFTAYPDSTVEADPSATLDALLRLDVSDRTEVDVSARYGLSLEDSGSARPPAAGATFTNWAAGLRCAGRSG
ncbi:MAG: outer membrane beta-barrel protein [Alphaproteobacteria bacterium]|nr:outer membrane beta-barrel protein [Alphaproteobacteria bacterium]